MYQIVCFDNTDGNYTGNPCIMVSNLKSRKHAVDMLKTYRAIPHDATTDPKYQFRYILTKQKEVR